MKTYELISHALNICLPFSCKDQALAHYTKLHRAHPKADISVYETVKFSTDEVKRG